MCVWSSRIMIVENPQISDCTREESISDTFLFSFMTLSYYYYWYQFMNCLFIFKQLHLSIEIDVFVCFYFELISSWYENNVGYELMLTRGRFEVLKSAMVSRLSHICCLQIIHYSSVKPMNATVELLRRLSNSMNVVLDKRSIQQNLWLHLDLVFRMFCKTGSNGF